MIKFNNLKQEAPFLIFKKKYDEALLARQKSIEAISISSYNQQTNECICNTNRFVVDKLMACIQHANSKHRYDRTHSMDLIHCLVSI